jgi:hypothetical protein
MFDCRLLIILIIGIALIILFEYDKKLKSDKYLYFLLPLALVIVLLYENYRHLFICPSTKKFLKWTTIFIFALSIYLYFRTKGNTYHNYVYRTSMRIIWCIILITLIVFWGDPEKMYDMGILKIILFVGLLLCLISIGKHK